MADPIQDEYMHGSDSDDNTQENPELRWLTPTANKAKTAQGKRVLKDRMPKMLENVKRAVVLKGRKASQVVQDLLTDWNLLKKPHTLKLTRSNDISPFEDISEIEKICEKHDAALFLFGSHSKKRPHNIVMGRLFNYKMLDMIEFGVLNYQAMQTFQHSCGETKPLFLFSGSDWHNNPTLNKVMNLFMDFFRNEFKFKFIQPDAIQHAIVCTASPAENGAPVENIKIHFRHYVFDVNSKFNDGGFEASFGEGGPRVDLVVRRVQFNEAPKSAFEVNPALTGKKKKNVDRNALGDVVGTIHMKKQAMNKMALRRMKAFRKPKLDRAAAAAARLASRAKSDDDEQRPRKRAKRE